MLHGTRRRLLAAAVAAAGLLGAPLFARAGTTVPGPLVSTDWLASHLDDVRVLDVRADVASYAGKSRAKTRVQGHIPGAVLLPWKEIRQKRVEDGRELVGMVLERERFQDLARRLGVKKGQAVVVTSRGESSGDITMATRVYWTFLYYGHDNVAVLDGGTYRWMAEGRPMTTEATAVQPGDFEAGPGRDDIYATTEEVMEAVRRGDVQLVDARTPDFYRGEKKKDYVYAFGHIEGAKNLPHPEMFEKTADGSLVFLTGEKALALLAKHGIDPHMPTITYCNSGHLASGAWFFMYAIVGNHRTELYDGSMHAFTMTDAGKALVVTSAE